jgi:hypothetical protein
MSLPNANASSDLSQTQSNSGHGSFSLQLAIKTSILLTALLATEYHLGTQYCRFWQANHIHSVTKGHRPSLMVSLAPSRQIPVLHQIRTRSLPFKSFRNQSSLFPRFEVMQLGYSQHRKIYINKNVTVRLCTIVTQNR